MFLDPASVALLEEHFPRRHVDSKIAANAHVTLAFAPDDAHLRKLVPLVGHSCQVRVLSEEHDGRCQAVRVQILSPEIGELAQKEQHITLSCAAGTQAAYAKEMCKMSAKLTDEVQALVLHGVVGVMFQSAANADASLEQLSGAVRKRILDFAVNAQAGEKLRFRAGELNSCARLLVHNFAESRGLQSQSLGRKGKGAADARQLTLTMPANLCYARRTVEVRADASETILQHASELDGRACRAKRRDKQGPSPRPHRQGVSKLVVNAWALGGWLAGRRSAATDVYSHARRAVSCGSMAELRSKMKLFNKTHGCQPAAYDGDTHAVCDGDCPMNDEDAFTEEEQEAKEVKEGLEGQEDARVRGPPVVILRGATN